VEGHLFNWSERVAVYLRLNSSSQCKLTGMFVNLVPPVNVVFDDLIHFDFTVKSRRQNMYYFLRIEVVAFDLEHPEVCVVAALILRRVYSFIWIIAASMTTIIPRTIFMVLP